MIKRETIAREIRRAMLDNPTEGAFNKRAAERERIADLYADVILKAIAESIQSTSAVNSGWQPIETAPKDGSLIMIGGTSYAGWFWSDAKWLDGLMMWSSTDDDWNVDCFEASHWMPLPAPPQGPDTRPVLPSEESK